MARYYFSGRIAQIAVDNGKVTIYMAPNAECTVSRKEIGVDGEMDNISIVVLQPVDTAIGGIAFQYEKHVALTISQTKQRQGCVCNIPCWVCGNNLMLELEENMRGRKGNAKERGIRSSERKMSLGQCVINCPVPMTFDIVRVTFK